MNTATYNEAAFVRDQRQFCSTGLGLVPVRMTDALCRIDEVWSVFTRKQWRLYVEEDLRCHNEISAVNATLEEQSNNVNAHMARRNKLSALLITSRCSELLDEAEQLESHRRVLRLRYNDAMEHAYGVYKLARTQTQTEFLGIALMYTTLLNCLK